MRMREGQKVRRKNNLAARPGGTHWQISDRVYPRCAILQQGIYLKVFSEVYCDRMYFVCVERFETGSGFDLPPPRLYSQHIHEGNCIASSVSY